MDREPKKLHGRTRSLNEKDLHDNLAYFKVPEDLDRDDSPYQSGPHCFFQVDIKTLQFQTGIESIRSKLAFKIFDEYSNILKEIYSTRFNG
jgi:hypothetical protein